MVFFFLGTSLEATHIARLQGRSIFKDIRAEAEEEIHQKLISKIDEFIDLANYDWLMTEPQGTSSSWLLDLIAFLNSVFLSFTNLPLKLAQMTCMSACQHLARSMMSMLMNETVKAISIGVLQQIDLDLCQCEQFAASEPIQGLEVNVPSYILFKRLAIGESLDNFHGLKPPIILYHVCFRKEYCSCVFLI